MSTLIDAHAHFHDCFALLPFLDSIAHNVRFEKERNQRVTGCLLAICHIGAGEPLEAIRSQLKTLSSRQDKWSVSTPDDLSIVLNATDSGPIVLIAARQVVTAEKLELLSVASSAPFENHLPLCHAVDHSWATDAIPVLPWGFGKWTFRRRQQLLDFLADNIEEADKRNLFLADSGCRLAVPRPTLMAHAERLGYRVLAGSDPLPLADHVRRAGSFGFVVDADVDLQAPASWLRKQLQSVHDSPPMFGRYRSVLPFVSDQFRLRWQKRSKQ